MSEFKLVGKDPDKKEVSDKTQLESLKTDVDSKIGNVHYIMVAVVLVLVVSVVTLHFMVVAMLNDSMRLNTAVYKEYTIKQEVNDALLETNKILLEENIKLKSVSTSTPVAI